MLTYDPNVDTMTPIPPQESNLNEDLARAALERQQNPRPPTSLGDVEKKPGVPVGLLRAPLNEPEKNVEEFQMADFATPIEEVMPGPGQMMQDEMMGSPYQIPQKSAYTSEGSEEPKKKAAKNPFGLQDDQYQALLAGVAAVVAFSKPVQNKLGNMVPKFLGSSGEISITGMAVTALVAAIIFYFAKKYLVEP